MRNFVSLLGLFLATDVVLAEDLSEFYGFRPLEIIKVTDRAGNLLAGDVNHDGLTDLVIADNTHHRIDFWLQQAKPAAKSPTKTASDKVNDLDDSSRFALKKLPVDQDLAAVTLGDFNGDQRTDVAYFGLPDKLIVRYQSDKGEWKEKSQQRLPDVAVGSWCIAAGDLDSDGRDDLVVLGKHETLVLYQNAQGELAPPVKLLNTSDKLGLVQVADLDGDTRHDLCYLAGDGLARVLCCRLQTADGKLGPEYVFDLERPRAVTLRDVDGKPGHEILTIDSRTGRLKVFQVRTKLLEKGELPERMIAYGFGKQGSGKDRDWAFGDFDGDKLTDLVVSDPGASRLILFRQQPKLGLDLGTPYPALAGIDSVRAADFDGDGVSELIVHSATEKVVGLSRFQDGRLTFPQALPIEGDLAQMEVADIAGDKTNVLAMLTKSKKGKDSEYQMKAVGLHADSWKELPLGDKTSVPLGLKGTPERMRHVDLNLDGRADFVIFQGGSKPPQTFLGDAVSGLKEVISSGGLNLPAVNSSAASVWNQGDKTGFLVSQDNFARWMTFDAERGWQVGDQFNVVESNANIVGALAIELSGGGGEPEIALVDAGVKKLRLWNKPEAVYAPWKEIDLTDISFKGIHAADLNGDQQPDLALISAEKILVLYSGGSSPVLQEIASFESQLDNVYPTDVAVGDLNGDGRIDLAVTDVRNHYLELLDFHPEQGLRHALYFRLFEHKSFAKEDTPDTEPREMVVADVTGDNRADLILLMHDRIVIHPQDDGREEPKDKNPEARASK